MSINLSIQEIKSGSSFVCDSKLYLLAGINVNKQDEIMQQNAFEFFRSKLIKHKIVATVRKQLSNGITLIDAFIGKSYINAELAKSGFYQIQDFIRDKYYQQQLTLQTEDLQKIIKQQDAENDLRIAAAFRLGEIQPTQCVYTEEMTSDEFFNQYKSQQMKGYISHFNSLDNVWCKFIVDGKIINQNISLYPVVSNVSLKQEDEKYNQQAVQLSQNYLQRTCQNIQLVKLINNKVFAIFNYDEKEQHICLNTDVLAKGYCNVLEYLIVDQYRPMFNKYMKSEKSGKKVQTTNNVESDDIQIGSTIKVLVTDIQNADNLTVMLNGKNEKIYFSSIMAPKINSFIIEDTAFEMRQILRQKYYMKYLKLRIDYERELINDQTQETVYRKYGTFYYQEQPIMEYFLQQGYVQLMKHKLTDQNRSCEYMRYDECAQGVTVRKATQLQVVDLNKLQQEQLQIKAQQLQTQTVSIEDIQAGGHIKILFKSQINKVILNQAIVCLVGNKVLSVKRQEFGAQEAQEYLKEKLQFRQVKCEFIGGVEKYTNAYYVMIENINQEMLSLGLSYYMPNKQLPQKIAVQLQQASQQAQVNKLGIYANDLKHSTLQLDQMSRLRYIPNAKIVNIKDDGKIVFITKSVPTQTSQNIDTHLQINKLIALEYNKQIIRGQIKQINEDNVTVYLPDYEKTITVNKLLIFQVEDSLQNAEINTFTSGLAFINHDYRFRDDEEKQKFVDELKIIYLEENTKTTIYCYQDPDGQMQSFVQEDYTEEMQPEMTVNCYLIENGFVGMSQCEGPVDIIQEFSEFQRNAVKSRVGIHN